MTAKPSAADAARDLLKRAAAEAAVELVEDGMVVGLGTGSTAAFAIAPKAAIRYTKHVAGSRCESIRVSWYFKLHL